MPFQSDFRGDGVLEGFGQGIWSVKNPAVVHVGDGHGHFAPFGFATWCLNGHAALPCDTTYGDLSQALEESVIETAGLLSTDGVGQNGSSRVGRALPLQTAHVRSERSEHVACGRVIHREPLASTFVLHGAILLGKMVHHRVCWRSGRVVSDGGASGCEGVSPWNA